MEPFTFNKSLYTNFDIFYSKFSEKARKRAFKYLEETNQVEIYLTEVFVCHHIIFTYDYPYKGYERKFVEILHKKSLKHQFDTQKASWDSQFKVPFTKRLTSQGFGYTFNVVSDRVILDFDE
jgi:hypothetical protein